MGQVKELMAYKISYELAIEIFQITKQFPGEEKYSLIDQIRRSSRSVCANLAEAYSRRYSRSYFVSKLSDCITENAETQVWLDFSFDLKYMSEINYQNLTTKNNEIGKLLRFETTQKILLVEEYRIVRD
ncbi:MAG: four helix bundle protein [Chitinophagaceae bacterium]|nr:four helix bundle protein [Chitinophagaceae bacterium]